MSAAPTDLTPPAEALLAKLTDAAYRVALRQGFKGSFIDVQLELWAALRRVLQSEPAAQEARARRNREVVRETEVCPV